MRSTACNIASQLVRTARCWPRLPAVAHGDAVRHDYAALARRAAGLAAGLRAAGLSAGDRVVLASRNVPEYVEALYGCWWAGIVAVPVNAKLHAKEMAFVLADCGARWALVDDAWRAALAAVAADVPSLARVVAWGDAEYRSLVARPPEGDPVAVAPDAPAWLFYTSGTTGRPKGVEITHANLAAMGQCFLSDVEGIEPGDALLHPAPLSHGSGLYVVPHVARGAVSVVPASGGFDAAEIATLLGRWSRSLFFAAPTMVKRLVDAPDFRAARLDRLKALVYGGGPMYVEDCKAAFAAIGPRLAQIYGQGESPMTITAMDRALLADALAQGDDARIASVGVAQTGIEVRIGGAEAASATGEVGEVLVRGPTVMRGYWRNPAATAATLAGGWLHTGDLGALDADGFLTLKDRSKDLIISGGSNIYPREVEEALLAHPGVAEVAVVGRRHAEWGEEVVACVVPRMPLPDAAAARALEATLDAVCLERIARFKRPKTYVFVAELPKNNTGKVLKTELRDIVG
ncbi:MAG: AMP-binding protein [Betaproteobacteria bacterium]|nr:AMP-binding protein [Betaproteobacteria bacterium]MCC7217115.1 AMP-binding protein [Burkholderiales bacterium]